MATLTKQTPIMAAESRLLAAATFQALPVRHAARARKARTVKPYSFKLNAPRKAKGDDSEFLNVLDKASGARLSFAFGNMKLPKTTLIISLPAVSTCPGAVAQGCGLMALAKSGVKIKTGHCYAIKRERQYANVRVSRQHNLDATKLPGFVQHAAAGIAEAIAKRGITMVRIHESGDFYSQGYFDLWALIAAMFPEVTFYAYTKSVRLDFSRRPENFVLLLSDDKGIWTAEHGRFDRVFRVDAPADQVDMICGQDCTVCDACVTGPARIGIAMH